MKSYKGWTNKQTWLVDQWMGDGLKQAAKGGQKITKAFVRQEVQHEMDLIHTFQSLSGDFIRDAIKKVDYDQIAKRYSL